MTLSRSLRLELRKVSFFEDIASLSEREREEGVGGRQKEGTKGEIYAVSASGYKYKCQIVNTCSRKFKNYNFILFGLKSNWKVKNCISFQNV